MGPESPLTADSQANPAHFFSNQGPIPDAFPKVSIGADSLSFNAIDTSTGMPGGDSMLQQNLGSSFSEIVQSAFQLPTGIGILSQFFEFLASLFSSVMNSAQFLDPSFLSQQAAQATMDSLKKP
jgi:hypothetical protein